MKIAIRHGHLIDPAHNPDQPRDIFIADSTIIACGQEPDGFNADRTIDATKKNIIPGIIDCQAHLREPGQEHKASIASETRAAAANGITTLCCPPDTTPVIDTPAVAEMIQHRAAQSGKARVYPIGALTRNLQGDTLTEMQALRMAGCIALSHVLHPITNLQTVLQALQYAATFDIPVFLHALEPELSKNGQAHQGPVSTRLGLKGIPGCAETIAIAQYLELIEESSVTAHFCQISTARGVEMISAAKKCGLPVTVDVAMHQLFLIDTDLLDFNSQCHVMPPLRTQNDRQALRSAVKNGQIDAICSDHQPHEADAKQAPLGETEPGISALDTLLPLALRLADEEELPLGTIVPLLTRNPAKILGLPAGKLDIGAPADITIIDPKHIWNLKESNISSAGKNTPFMNWEFTGKVSHTLLAGHTVFELESKT